MKKRTTILLIIFLLIAGGTTVFLMNRNDNAGTIDTTERDFRVDDISKIHKIFIADRGKPPVTLERADGYWIYNEKYKARPSAVRLILDMLQQLQIKFIPPGAAMDNVVTQLAANGIKIELYDENDEKMKAFYIGGMTNDERGTYMIMEDANQPFAMHMPGFEGNLRARFEKEPDNWRDKTVFETPYEQIQSVSIEYPTQKNASFKIERQGDQFELTPFYDITPSINKEVNEGLIDAYLMGFEVVYAEAFENQYRKKDEIRSQIPFATLTVKTTGGEEKTVTFWPKQEYDRAGNIIPIEEGYTYERYYADINGEDFMIVQHLNFKNFFWSYETFFES